MLSFASNAAHQTSPILRVSGLPSCRIFPRHDVWALQLNARRSASSWPTLLFPILKEAVQYAERHGLAYRIEGVACLLQAKAGDLVLTRTADEGFIRSCRFTGGWLWRRRMFCLDHWR
jgi:hypothetical protein